jgi:hypothetical protein
MHLTTIRLDPDHHAVRQETRDLCAMHSRIIDATAGMDTDGPRVLWATPSPGMLVIRAPEPVTSARLPAGYATAITHRLWSPPGRPGDYRMVAVLNPGRSVTILGPTLNQPDRKRSAGQPKLLTDPGEQEAWLTRRLNAGGSQADGAEDDAAARIDGFRVTRTWVGRGRHRTGRTITARLVAISATVTVTDPAAVAAAVLGGVGIDKTWGAGLTLWEAA